MRAAVLLLLCASSALAAPDPYELAGRGRDWLVRQVHAGEVTKEGPSAQAHALLAIVSPGYTHRAGPYKRAVNLLNTELKAVDPATLPPLTRAQLVWALSELLALSRDHHLEQPTERALASLLEVLTPAGLPLAAGEAPDLVATFTAAWALRAAKRSSVKVPDLELREGLAALVAASDDPVARAGHPAAAIVSGARTSSFREPEHALPAMSELDLEGCFWAAQSAYALRKPGALSRDELADRVAALTVAGRGADGAAAKPSGAARIRDTALAVLALDTLFLRAAFRSETPWVSPEALQALPAVAAASDPKALVAHLVAAGGQRWEAGYQQGHDFIAQHAEARLALAQLVAAREDPASSYRFKRRACSLLELCPTPPEPEALLFLAEFLVTQPPADLAAPLSEMLGKALDVPGRIHSSSGYPARLEVVEQLLTAARTATR